MNKAALLEEFDSLPYGARMRRLYELGRNPMLRPVFDELEQGEFYERWLALLSCFGSRDGERVMRRLADPSRAIRQKALHLLAICGTDEQVIAGLVSCPPRRVRRFLVRLLKLRRRPLAELCVERLVAGPERVFLPVLSLGSAEQVRRHLPGVIDHLPRMEWLRLAKSHPKIAVEQIGAQADAATAPDAGLLHRASTVIGAASQTHPDPYQIAALIHSLLRLEPSGQFFDNHLPFRLPIPVAKLVLSTEAAPWLALQNMLPKLPQTMAIRLLERYPSQSESVLTKRFPPALRDAVYLAFGRGWRDADGAIAPETVALLSGSLREAEGRRHLQLPGLSSRPRQRLPYGAFLPWDEARALLDPYLRNPDPELRQPAHTALAGVVRYRRDRLPELLALQISKKNEQDPVRHAMLRGLAHLPPGIWRAGHLDDLRRIFEAACGAADLSRLTSDAMELLTVRLLPFHPAWTLEWLPRLALQHGSLTSSFSEETVSDAQVALVAPALLPVLRAWEERSKWAAILQAARGVGRRLRRWEDATALLERLVLTPATRSSGELALDLISAHRPDLMEKLVPALLTQDPSWATRFAVHQFLHRRRQDLLTPYLGWKAYSGRFSTGRTRFVPPFKDGFYRWTGRQQMLFAEVLEEVSRDGELDIFSLFQVIDQMAALPAVHPQRLIQLAALQNPKTALRDSALIALGRLDAGQGFDVLVAAMNDARARIAIYALRAAILEMPVARALALLRTLPMEQVTVAKEVIRLMGDLQSDEALDDLLALDGRELHRDVRVALLRALWNYLHRDAAWDVLERAAASDDPAIAAHLTRIPAEGLRPRDQKRLIALLVRLLDNEDPAVRLGVLNRCSAMPVPDPDALLLPAYQRALQSGIADQVKAAGRALFATGAGRDAATVAGIVQAIMSDRRALAAFIDTVAWQVGCHREALAPVARAVIGVLQTDPLTSQLRVQLALHALPPGELAPFFEQMASTRELHADALAAAISAMGTAAWSRSDDAVVHLEAALGTNDDRYLRRLALSALVTQAEGPAGWTDPLLARLAHYRRDPAPLVAEAAQFTFPPDGPPDHTEDLFPE